MAHLQLDYELLGQQQSLPRVVLHNRAHTALSSIHWAAINITSSLMSEYDLHTLHFLLPGTRCCSTDSGGQGCVWRCDGIRVQGDIITHTGVGCAGPH